MDDVTHGSAGATGTVDQISTEPLSARCRRYAWTLVLVGVGEVMDLPTISLS